MSDKLKKVLKYIGIGIVFVLIALALCSPLFVPRTFKKPTINVLDNTTENVSLASGLGGVSNISTDYADSYQQWRLNTNLTFNQWSTFPVVITGVPWYYKSASGTNTYNKYGFRITYSGGIYTLQMLNSNSASDYSKMYSTSTGWSNTQYQTIYITGTPTNALASWLAVNGTWVNKPVTNPTISFRIDGISFTVDEGSTFAQFVSSSSNTLGYVLYNNYVTDVTHTNYLTKNGELVTGNDVIYNGDIITYTQTSTFNFNGNSYRFFSGMSWSEYCSSYFNTDFEVDGNMIKYGSYVVTNGEFPVLPRENIEVNFTYQSTEFIDYEYLYNQLVSDMSNYNNSYWLNNLNVDFDCIYTGTGDNIIFTDSDNFNLLSPIVYQTGTYGKADFKPLVNSYKSIYSGSTNISVDLILKTPIVITADGLKFTSVGISRMGFAFTNGYNETYYLNDVTHFTAQDLSNKSAFSFVVQRVTLTFSDDVNDFNVVFDNNSSFNNGYDKGRADGFREGEDIGYNNGFNDGEQSAKDTYLPIIADLRDTIDGMSNGQFTLGSLLWTVGAVPMGVLSQITNFEVLGVNIFGLITGILTALILVWICKKIIGK